MAIVVVAFGWFYMQEQFFWAIIVAFLVFLFAGYLDLRQLVHGLVYGRKGPVDRFSAALWRRLNIANVAMAIVTFLFWAFAWFYMREQFFWAIILTFFFLIPVLCVNILALIYDYFRLREIGNRQSDG